jgi:hypothetical protein
VAVVPHALYVAKDYVQEAVSFLIDVKAPQNMQGIREVRSNIELSNDDFLK